MAKTLPKKHYCLFTQTSASGRIEQKIGPTGLSLDEAYREVYAYNQAPYGSMHWSPWGWKIGILPPEVDERRQIPKSRKLTTGICTRSGRLIPFGTKCTCGCKRWNRRYKKINGQIKDVRKTASKRRGNR